MKKPSFKEQQKEVNGLLLRALIVIDKDYETKLYFVGVVMCIVVLWLMWLTFGL